MYPKIFVLRTYQSYKNTNAQEIVDKTARHFFNVKPKWCHCLKCTSLVVFPFKRIR